MGIKGDHSENNSLEWMEYKSPGVKTGDGKGHKSCVRSLAVKGKLKDNVNYLSTLPASVSGLHTQHLSNRQMAGYSINVNLPMSRQCLNFC